MASSTCTGEFQVEMAPEAGLIEGTWRLDFTKVWTGAIAGSGTGVMMSAGDPATGAAGYVALERFEGVIDGRSGTVCFQQFGTMDEQESSLTYAVVPGSGTGELAGLAGDLDLDTSEGHAVTLTYTLPD